MKIPQGLRECLGAEIEKDECLILVKSIYSLMQAVRHFFKKLTSVLIEAMRFEKCFAGQCLLII